MQTTNTMNCRETTESFGELLDGALAAPARDSVERHLATCPDCRTELESVRRLTAALSSPERIEVPASLWLAIEARLDGAAVAAPQPHTATFVPPAPRFFTRRQWVVFAAAAGLVMVVGLSLFYTRGQAQAAGIDFRPILEQADGDIRAGISGLMEAHGGRPITLNEAKSLMNVRIHIPDKIPLDMKLEGMFLLKLGSKHRSLGFHLSGPRGQLLLMQCPSGVRKSYGNQECLPCKLGAGHDQPLRVGALRLLHRDSENLCMCILSTLDETSDLLTVLDAIPVDY